jgi:hypothetical protein
MKNYQKIIIAGMICLTVAGIAWIKRPHERQEENLSGSYSSEITLLNATSTTATSTGAVSAQNIENAKRVTFEFSRGDTTGTGNSGSSIFSVEVSDTSSVATDTPWVDFNMLVDNVTNTNSQQLTRVSEVTLPAGTSTKYYPMDLTSGNYKYVRCIVEELTDGNHTCKMRASY